MGYVQSQWVCILLFCMLLGCSSSECFRDHVYDGQQKGIHSDGENYDDVVQVRYFGAGGFLIRKGPDAVLLAPFFSNRSIPQLFTQRLVSDIQTIDDQFEGVALEGVQGILVGHAHYDHLLDVPYIADRFFISQQNPIHIYGSLTVMNLISDQARDDGISMEHIVPVVGDSVTTKTHLSDYIWVGQSQRIRFRAIASMHAPHVGNMKFFCGDVPTPRQSLPNWAIHWKEGQTLAYLIDFLDENQNPIFRIHYQDTASDTTVSLPQAALLAEKAVDLSIVCVASFNNVQKYPGAVLNMMKPKHVILAHWENFFVDYQKNLKVDTVKPVPGSNPCDFIDQMTASYDPVGSFDWHMPLPGTWLHYPSP